MVKKILILLLVVFVLGLTYWLSVNNTFGTTVKVVVGPKWVNQTQFAGIFSAVEQGYYRRQGLEVEVKEFDFSTNQVEDLLSSKTDFAIISAEEFLVLVNDGKELKALAAIYQVSPYAVVSLKDKGIVTPADLESKILGNKGGKLEEELFYKLLLSSVGLSVEDTTIIDLGLEYSEYEDLLRDNSDTVGLYRTDQMYFFDKEGLDYNIIYPEQYGVNTFNDIIVARNDFVDSNPEYVRAFITATVEGWNYALDNPEEAVEDTLKYVTNENYLDFDYELFILNQSTPLIRPDVSTPVGSMTTGQWSKLYKQMMDRGFVGDDIIIQDIFTTEFLP